MFSALVVILLLAGPSLQFTMESADSDPDCSCKQISPSITRCELCYEPDGLTEPDTCTVSEGPNASCSSMRADLLAHKSQTRFQTKCRCRCKDDGICQCEVCPVVAPGALIEPGCGTHEGPNLSCSSLQKSANLEAFKTQTRVQQIQCSCTDYFNGSWRCQVCVNNSCKDKSGRGPKPAGCSHSWGPWRSNINYHGDDDVKTHKGQSQCNCQCQNGDCHGQCCDSNGCTSNPDCSSSSLELLSDNNYHGDDDLRAHKSQYQCNCQCDDDGCQGQCCDANGCTSNPDCSSSSLELWSDNNYHGDDDIRAHKRQYKCDCQCDDNDFCHGQCCDAGYCTSNPGCGYIHDYDNDDDLRSHKSQYQCNCQCDDDGCHGQCCDANGCTSNPDCY